MKTVLVQSVFVCSDQKYKEAVKAWKEGRGAMSSKKELESSPFDSLINSRYKRGKRCVVRGLRLRDRYVVDRRSTHRGDHSVHLGRQLGQLGGVDGRC